MKLYVGHSREWDYSSRLYIPLRRSSLDEEHEIILPHETADYMDSIALMPSLDAMIAEVSYPSTGLGMEIYCARVNRVPVMALFMKGKSPGSSVKRFANSLLEYASEEQMLFLLGKKLEVLGHGRRKLLKR